MRFRLLIGMGWLLLSAIAGHADTDGRFLEILPVGSIDWTQGIVTANGTHAPVSHAGQTPNDEYVFSMARRAAQSNALATLESVRMDGPRYAVDLMADNDKVAIRVSEMIEAAGVDRIAHLDGRAEVTIQVPLLGSFAQLMLPEDIRQVEPIRPVQVVPESTREDSAQSGPTALPDASGVYTGLVIDARGIGARPAMAPAVVDEIGKPVYGPAFISREYAVQHGVCLYVRRLEAPVDHSRVAPRPLSVKALRTLPNRNCDIVITNADAARIRGAPANLDFLRQCRVIIILD